MSKLHWGFQILLEQIAKSFNNTQQPVPVSSYKMKEPLCLVAKVLMHTTEMMTHQCGIEHL